RANTEARLLVDGISIAVPQAGGTNYLTDPRNSQEVNFTTSGSLGEVESGGPVMNIVPRSGGNKMSASGFVSWANSDLQGNYANATTSPEANGYGDLHPMRFQQATWSSPVNNKVLLEGGFGYFFSRWGGRAKEDPNTESLARIIEQCAAGCPNNGNIPNLM